LVPDKRKSEANLAITALLTAARDGENDAVIYAVIEDVATDPEVARLVVGGLIPLAAKYAGMIANANFGGDWAAAMADLRRRTVG
jgi:hypothetical protein